MNPSLRHLHEIWWLLMLRGIALVLFGVVAVLWPGLTLVALAVAFAAYLLIGGIVNIIDGVLGIGRRSLWFLTLVIGLAELGVAIWLLKNHYVLGTFIAVVGLSLVILGILEIIAAFEPGEDAGRRFLTIVGGALALIAGFITLRYPVSSGFAFTWVLGLWGLVAGALQIAMCLSLHSRMTALEHSRP
jgi:uncharacterized membrane protein HdeD (DUF308 family)